MHKRLCQVTHVEVSAVKVQWLDEIGGTADIPIEWWRGDAFKSVPVPHLHPTCELCGVRFTDAFCNALCADDATAKNCQSCSALRLLARGAWQEAKEQMRAAVRKLLQKPHEMEALDAVSRHWASLRTAVGLLDAYPSPVPVCIDDVDKAQAVDVSSLDAFHSSWQRWAGRYLASKSYREQMQLKITLQASRAKRIHGDGSEQESARRRAEESQAWRERLYLVEGRAKCLRGMQHVQRLPEQGKISIERAEGILAQKRHDLELITTALAQHEQGFDFREALSAIEAYARWYHGSGLAALHEQRVRYSLQLPAVSGKFLEEVAVRWLQSEMTRMPALESGVQRKLLKNVTFPHVALPQCVAAEFDAFVVLCRPCDDPKRAPRNLGPVVGKGLLEVIALERWIEVKSSPDEVFEAWCRHRDARVALAAWTGYIGCDAGSDGHLWFPAHVFDEFTGGVTFVTMPGCSAVVRHGSHVPRSLLTSTQVLFRLFQFALDRLNPPLAMDIDEPSANWDYVEELYARAGEIFMYEGEKPEDYRGYLQEASKQLRELVQQGQVLIVPDPFQECFIIEESSAMEDLTTK